MESILPIATLILGWTLNEITRYFSTRRDNRKPISAAISDLLLIRHEILANRVVIKELLNRIDIPAELHPEFTALMKWLRELLLPKQTDLGTRYDNAVSLIAATDPVLGFRLRSQHLIEDYLVGIGKLGGTDKEAMKFFTVMEEKMANLLIPFLEEMILALAKLHGPFTSFEVRRILKQGTTLPSEIEEMLQEIQQHPAYKASVEEIKKLSGNQKPGDVG